MMGAATALTREGAGTGATIAFLRIELSIACVIKFEFGLKI
jgi:hypothetical protein